jgi:hypothetical protein
VDIEAVLASAPQDGNLSDILASLKDGAGKVENLLAEAVSHIQAASSSPQLFPPMISTATRRLETTGTSTGNQQQSSRDGYGHRSSDDFDNLPPFMHGSQANHPYAIHEAIQNGDASFFEERLQRLRRHSFASFSQSGRRLVVNYSKEGQCQQLYECAKDYTLYDLVVYLYTDDIDEDSGEIDSNKKDAGDKGIPPLQQFDDEDLLDKYTKIHRTIDDLSDQSGDFQYKETDCDFLLEQFHRFAESESPVDAQWVQGSINSVCRSPQKYTFVSYKDLAITFGSQEGVLTRIIGELVACAYDLHNNRPQYAPYKQEGFLFDSFQIPTDIKDTPDDHGELPHGGKSFFNDGVSFPNDMFAFEELIPAAPKVDYVYPPFKFQVSDTVTPYECRSETSIQSYYLDLWARRLPLYPVNMTSSCSNNCGDDVKEERSFVYDALIDGCDSTLDGRAIFWPNAGWAAAGSAPCHNSGEICAAYKATTTLPPFACNKDSCKEGDVLEKGIELAFGKTTVGEVCAVSRKVAGASFSKKEESMPGYCCLDTPTTSQFWGVSVSVLWWIGTVV